MTGRRTAVALVARSRLRRGLLGVVALAIVVGITGGAAIAAIAGARRTDSAYRRLLHAAGTADVSVGLEDAPPGPAFGRRVLALPQVAGGDTLVGFGSLVAGAADAEGRPRFGPSLVGAERGRLFASFNRLQPLAGRAFRSDAVGEVVANTAAVDLFHLRVGSRVHLELLDFPAFIELSERASADGRNPTAAELDAITEPVELHVVGIGSAPENIVAPESSSEDAGLLVSPAFVDRHRADAGFTRVYVDLRDPRRDLEPFSTAVQRAFPDEGASLTPATTNAELYDRSVAPYVRALQLFALVVIIAGILVVGQAAARLTVADALDVPVLRGLGLGPGPTSLAIAARGIAAGVLGALVAGVVAVAASPIFPLGLGGDAEPDPGVSVDGLVLLCGAVGIVIVIGGRALLTGGALARAARRPDEPRPRSPSRAGAGLANVGVSPAVALGIGSALRVDRRGRRAPLWSVLPGLVAAVLALVAALGFGASLDHFVSRPRLYGWDWDLSFDGFDVGNKPAEEELAADPDLAAWAAGARGSVSIGGRLLPALGVAPRRGDLSVRVTDGRPPSRRDEIALGARDLDALGRSVGDTVVATASDGRRRLRYRIVGRTVVPALSLSENVGLADGATLTLAGLRRVDPGVETSFFLVRARPGAIGAIRARYGSRFAVLGPQRPREVVSFDRVRSTPILLAVLLAFMGAAALAHALVLSVRGGRPELAVLKALGFTRRQVSVTVAAHATTLAVLALVIGLPLGLAAGRWVWELFVGPLGLDAPAIVPVARIGVVSVATLVLANLVAAVPARAAARTSPAIVLRTE
jgi:hypothetical protein